MLYYILYYIYVIITYFCTIDTSFTNLSCWDGYKTNQIGLTFNILNFSFPVANSITTALIISRGNRIKHQIRELLNELHVIRTRREAS